MARSIYQLQAGRFTLPLGIRTSIMGIINMTPDSFSQDGYLASNDIKKAKEKALRKAYRMIEHGADILDVGGESSRPGSKRISAQEEIIRVVPLIHSLAKKIKIPISIDTYKPETAQHALEAGAVIVNNIFGTHVGKKLLRMVRNYKAAIVLMHMRGTPLTMQKKIRYKNLIEEILGSLKNSIENCLEIGIKSDRIIVDPGIGFGKTLEHNLEILNRLKEFQILKKPVLVGASRKSFIGKILSQEANQRLFGTLSTVAISILNGAHIVRVHDILAVKKTADIADSIIHLRNINEKRK